MPRKRIFLEKLRVTQLAKKIPASYANLNSSTLIASVLLLFSVRHIEPVHIILTYFS